MTEIAEIFDCYCGLSDGVVIKASAIEYEGKLWLVTGWLLHDSGTHTIPERLIRIDQYRPQRDGQVYQNVLLPIPESALRGELPPEIEHIDRPRNLRLNTPRYGERH